MYKLLHFETCFDVQKFDIIRNPTKKSTLNIDISLPIIIYLIHSNQTLLFFTQALKEFTNLKRLIIPIPAYYYISMLKNTSSPKQKTFFQLIPINKMHQGQIKLSLNKLLESLNKTFLNKLSSINYLTHYIFLCAKQIYIT